MKIRNFKNYRIQVLVYSPEKITKKNYSIEYLNIKLFRMFYF